MAKVGIYPAYLFKSHDPVLDAVQTVIEDSGESLKVIHEKSGVTVGTLKKWLAKETKTPQWKTIAAVVSGLGGTVNITYGGRTIPVRGLAKK